MGEDNTILKQVEKGGLTDLAQDRDSVGHICKHNTNSAAFIPQASFTD
jgi:hypothetical protein